MLLPPANIVFAFQKISNYSVLLVWRRIAWLDQHMLQTNNKIGFFV